MAKDDRPQATLYDAVVVGGGITGLGIARFAARNGFTVAVLERGDLASGASSASSHMLHGGLRYLEYGHFTLVREALEERAAVSRMAPDVAHPTRFLIPFYRGDRRPPWMVRLGLLAYDAFAGRGGFSPHTAVRAREALALEPELTGEGLRGAALYSDAVMDDARLAVAVARDAAAHGAVIHTYTEAVGVRPLESGAVEVLGHDRIAGLERRLAGRVLINATGPWTDRTRAALLGSLRPGSADPAPVLRPSRGIHLVFPAFTQGHGVLWFARHDGRVLFVIPFAGHALVGTTEVEVTSPIEPDALAPSVEEVRYLRAELARAFPRTGELPALAVTSGVRPLIAGAGAVGAASREHRVIEEGPMLTVAGGKYTTFRLVARDAVAALRRMLKRGGPPLRDSLDPLPRALGATDPEALAAVAAEQAFARRIGDVIRRRSVLWLTPDRGRVAAPAVAAGLSKTLGWTPERTRAEIQGFYAGLEREDRLLHAAREVA
jgi:glycerol-3-phosphate dehydrogenase